MNNESSFRNLTIHLSKENESPELLIKVTDSLTEKSVPVGGRTLGRLFIKQPESKPPTWADFFDPYVQPNRLVKLAHRLLCCLCLFTSVGRRLHLVREDTFWKTATSRIDLVFESH